ncbi:hypothetical protein [Paracoccus sp. SSK6]|uniref:hypothetical protein n=1 Tax=Paracoccus sp. SSK6 TaxID=3143131 RepID=UPI00321B1D18
MDRFQSFTLGLALGMGIIMSVVAGAAHAEASDGTRVAVPAVRAPASIASGKFCGKLLHKDKRPMDQIRLTNLASVHAEMTRERPFSDYVRRGAGDGIYHGYVLWGYDPKLGFSPIYFVPSNVPTDEC